MRLRNKPWAGEEIKNHPHIVIPNPKDLKGKWQQLFGNDNPIYIEVGTGKGQFLTKMGELHPNINFIFIRREDSHFNEAKRSKWEMNRLNYILLKII